LISFIKNRMLSPEEIRKIMYRVDKKDYPVEPIYTAYQQYLQRENLMDFDLGQYDQINLKIQEEKQKGIDYLKGILSNEE